MTPSKYQQNVLEFITKGRGHGIVEAVAGSGKTTLLSLAAHAIKSMGMAVCFNKHAATHLASKLQGTSMRTGTVHSLGLQCLRENFGSVDVNNTKYLDEIKGFCEARKSTYENISTKQISKCFDLVRLNSLEPTISNLEGLIQEHLPRSTLLTAKVLQPLLQHLSNFGKVYYRNVDFTDMIWLPTELRLHCSKYSWLLVDEAQDISLAQFKLIQTMLRKQGRILFVGDRRQAIYHFAGANAESFETIQQELKATILPLSVCYRCPTKVLDLARRYCPQLENAPNAKEGEIVRIKESELDQHVQEGDLVLGRITADLVRLCYTVISKNISAVVKGRDIGQALIQLLDSVCQTERTMDLATFFRNLRDWKIQECLKLQAISNENTRDRLQQVIVDQVLCLEAVALIGGNRTLPDMVNSIETLFSDHRASVTFSTIHRAKGLEEPRVFVLWPLPVRNDLTDVQAQQEENLAYVALTRASEKLFLVAPERTIAKTPQSI